MYVAQEPELGIKSDAEEVYQMQQGIQRSCLTRLFQPRMMDGPVITQQGKGREDLEPYVRFPLKSNSSFLKVIQVSTIYRYLEANDNRHKQTKNFRPKT